MIGSLGTAESHRYLDSTYGHQTLMTSVPEPLLLPRHWKGGTEAKNSIVELCSNDTAVLF